PQAKKPWSILPSSFRTEWRGVRDSKTILEAQPRAFSRGLVIVSEGARSLADPADRLSHSLLEPRGNTVTISAAGLTSGKSAFACHRTALACARVRGGGRLGGRGPTWSR